MADPNDIRTKMILKDIYARNKLHPSMPLDKAVNAIGFAAKMRGDAASAWANPEERARAREEYAAKGKTPQEVHQRWEKSAYLLDPASYQYQQSAGRDLDFLMAHHESQNIAPDPNAGMSMGGGASMPSVEDRRRAAVSNALAYWDESNFEPLYRDSWVNPNYGSEGSFVRGLQNATENPDVPVGNYMNFSEVVPDRIRLGGSGEASTGQEAWEGAQGKRMALNRYRLSSPSPVLDLPDGATQAQREARLRELQGLTQKAAVPAADQRWARWTQDTFGKSFVPPGIVTDSLDFLTSAADPTMLIPAGGAAAGLAQVAGKGARVAGKGWVKPLLANLTKSVGMNTAGDQAVEQGVGHGISGAVGGAPGRTMNQYLFGTWNDPAKKSDQEVDESRRARSQLYETLKDDDRVSTADAAAYDRLKKAGRVPVFTH